MSRVFTVMEILNDHQIHFFIQQLRSKSLTIFATFVGYRLEIEVFDDDHIEIARFSGDESVEGGLEVLLSLIEELQ